MEPRRRHHQSLLQAETAFVRIASTSCPLSIWPPLWYNTLIQCVVWWIASRAGDEQSRGRTASRGVFLWWSAWRGIAPSLLALGEIQMASTVVAISIYRGPGPLPKN